MKRWLVLLLLLLVPTAALAPSQAFAQAGVSTDFVPKGMDAAVYRNGRLLFARAAVGGVSATDAARGAALLAAKAAATTDNDQIYVGAGTFALATSVLDLSRSGAGRVHLCGAGFGSTIITSTNTDGGANFSAAVLHPGTNSVVSGVQVQGALTNGDYQAVVGGHSDTQSAFTDASFFNCRFVGHSDVFYVSHATACSARFYNCEFLADFDAAVVSGNTSHLFEFYSCYFNATGPNLSASAPGRCRTIRVNQGKVRTFNCNVLCINGGDNDNKAYNTIGANGTIEIFGGHVTSTNSGAATAYDLFNAAGTITVGGLDYDAAKTSGTITQAKAFGVAPTTTGIGLLGGTTQSAAKLFAGPTSGAAAAPAFRSQVDTDTPQLMIGGGLVRLTGARFVNGFFSDGQVGNNDLYVCPSGKRAICSRTVIYNGNANTDAFYMAFKSGGTYYPIANSQNVTTLATGAFNNVPTMILDAGETIAVNHSVTTANTWVSILEYDNTVPLKGVKVLSLANGTNTIYTVPASTTAALLDTNCQYSAATGAVFYWNGSGGARTISTNIVPSGGAVATGNQVSGASISDATRSSQLLLSTLGAGDFINFSTNADTGTQWVWCNILEIPQ